ncbi:MAG: hypothetical protein ACXADY_19575 [Candidatus Hodarchaeales archaeon]|jgi:hypothetical protein
MKNDKRLNVSEILNSLSENFTEDAIFLIHSYFDNLQKKLESSEVPQTKQGFIIRGLYYFINEFIEDHTSKNNIISFETTLEILNEIGSPTDIIQTLSFTKDSPMMFTTKDNGSSIEPISTFGSTTPFSESPQKVNQLIVCKYCYTSNSFSSNYCENCGRNLSYQQDLPQSIKQEIIDHNYFITFLFCWFGLALFQVIFYASSGISIFSLLFPDIRVRSWGIRFPEDLALSMILSFIPAIIVTFIIGFIFDELYLNKLKSSKQKYDQAIENLYSRFILGIWLTVFGIILFVFLILNGFSEFILPLFIALGIYVASFWNHFFLGGKPSNVPYFKLLSTKKMLDNHAKEKYFMFNPILILISVFLVTLWTILANSYLHPEIQIQELILIGGLVLITIIIISNGIFFLYFYNWSNIKKFLHREVMKVNDPTSNLIKL